MLQAHITFGVRFVYVDNTPVVLIWKDFSSLSIDTPCTGSSYCRSNCVASKWVWVATYPMVLRCPLGWPFQSGKCKTWTLDRGLDCGLDSGLDQLRAIPLTCYIIYSACAIFIGQNPQGHETCHMQAVHIQVMYIIIQYSTACTVLSW